MMPDLIARFPRLFLALLALVALLLTATVQAGEVYAPRGVALEGYDPVAYFVDEKAVKGRSKYQTEYGGVTWYFANETNLDTFLASPADYQPEYGGYCAFGVAARDRLIKSDPTIFDVIDGKLYLNFNRRFQDRWQQNHSRLQRRADANWKRLGD